MNFLSPKWWRGCTWSYKDASIGHDWVELPQLYQESYHICNILITVHWVCYFYRSYRFLITSFIVTVSIVNMIRQIDQYFNHWDQYRRKPLRLWTLTTPILNGESIALASPTKRKSLLVKRDKYTSHIDWL